MTVGWRLDKAKRSQTEAFSGEGARKVGGRWNLPGTRAVYASQSLALAALERFVHAGEEGRRTALVRYRIAIPSSVRVHRLAAADLPKDWREQPVPISTQRLGSAWLTALRGAVLAVPSVIVPEEMNLVLNPAHRDFRKLKVTVRRPFAFDARMWE